MQPPSNLQGSRIIVVWLLIDNGAGRHSLTRDTENLSETAAPNAADFLEPDRVQNPIPESLVFGMVRPS